MTFLAFTVSLFFYKISITNLYQEKILRLVITTILSCLFIFGGAFAQNEKHLILGKIVKTKKEINGNQYFVTYKTKNKTLAYPIKNPSEAVKKMHGKMVRIWGKTEFAKSPYQESKYLMYFKIDKADVLTMKDLGLKDENLDEERFKVFAENSPRTMRNPKSGAEIEISDTAANTAIFIGGAVLAAEVLRGMAAAN